MKFSAINFAITAYRNLFKFGAVVNDSLIKAAVVLLVFPHSNFRAEGQVVSNASNQSIAIGEIANPALAVLSSDDHSAKPKVFGAGFFISQDGILVTARHIIQGQSHLVAVTQDGKRHVVTGYLGENKDYDIAVVKVGGTVSDFLPLTTISLPKTNQWIAIVSPSHQWLSTSGNTAPDASLLLIAQVNAVVDFPDMWTTIITSPVRKSIMVGSPLLNSRGDVVGIVAASELKEHILACPIRIAREIVTKRKENVVAFGARPKDSSQALASNPDFREGILAMATYNRSRAQRYLRTATKKFPDNPIPFALLGLTSFSPGNWAEAQPAFAKAVQLKPDSPNFHWLNGTSLAMLGRKVQAVDELRKSTDLPGMDGERLTHAWQVIVRFSHQLGLDSDVKEALENLNRINPDEASKLREKLKKLEADRSSSVSAALFSGGNPQQTAMLENARRALVILLPADNQGNTRSMGAGFFVSADGAFVTVRHVAQAEEKLLALTHDGKLHAVSDFIGENVDHDLAVLKLEGNNFPYLPLAKTIPGTNEWTAVISPRDQWAALYGGSNGAPSFCSTGRVILVDRILDLLTTIVTTMPIEPGESGSPLLNEAGEVFGVGSVRDGEGHLQGPPVQLVRNLIERQSPTVTPFSSRTRNDDLSVFIDKNFRHGLWEMKTRSWTTAERAMKRAAKQFPLSPLPQGCLGIIKISRHSWQAAHEHLTAALEMRPDAGLLYVFEGFTLLHLGKSAQSVEAVRRGLALGLSKPEFEVLAWTTLANADFKLGNHEKVDDALRNLKGLDVEKADSLRKEIDKKKAEAEKASIKKGKSF